MTTCIRGASWLVMWDSAHGRHVYVRDADIAFAGNEIIHVGPRYRGSVEAEVVGASLMADAGSDKPPLPSLNPRPDPRPRGRLRQSTTLL